ncbi:MAG TPA: (deoxy)nucleoside triphosphate pyrophosphohydrolase [Bryobacteraceae bacterium]|nr:(deoxy)nucleoside triphosphate pyrophosphohydrolase [Bryobacteraceae bacterium]
MRGGVLKVAAAVIERDGLILIGQRRRSDSHPLKWEFPGGKIEHHEHPAAALQRELREELGIEAAIGSEIVRYEHRYPRGALIHLIFYRVTAFTGEPRNLAFEKIDWAPAERLPRYDFVDGDVDFVRRLAAGQFRAGAA